jgi:serine racemase
MDSREQTAARVQQDTGATFIPPYNYGPTISGQGTIALELLNQVGVASPVSACGMPMLVLQKAVKAHCWCAQVADLECIIVPVSGGGMISGISIAAKGMKPDIKIIAAEPKGMACAG